MRAADSSPTREHWGRRVGVPLSRRTLVLLAALCTLAMLTSAADSWRRRSATSGCAPEASAPPQPDEASPADTASLADAEPPDSAALAICVIVKVAADDPQWRDGRAEDVHEARAASSSLTLMHC